jgi:hypothetical protein
MQNASQHVAKDAFLERLLQLGTVVGVCVR